MTGVMDDANHVIGIFTDGDLRRALDGAVDVHNTAIGELMTRDCKTVNQNMLAAEAVLLLEHHEITQLLVVDDEARLVGALNIHDLFRAGVM